MAEKSREPFWRRNNPIMWGVLATAAVIIFGIWAGSLSVCQTDFWGNQSCAGSKWSVFLEASPNEVGDTLAGFAGALAFVWLIATVWLQGQELAAQRQELAATRTEMMMAREAQEQQVSVMKEQAEVFRDEQAQRKEQRAKELLDGRLQHTASIMKRGPDLEVKFVLSKGEATQPQQVYLAQGLTNEEDTDIFLGRVFEHFLKSIEHRKGQVAVGWQISKRMFEKDRVQKLSDLLDRTSSEVNDLSNAEKERLKAMQLNEFQIEFRWLYFGDEATQ
ncbi:hypothetical protein ACUXV3_16010 [Roseobacteraceae bacterium NS-SX3]